MALFMKKEILVAAGFLLAGLSAEAGGIFSDGTVGMTGETGTDSLRMLELHEVSVMATQAGSTTPIAHNDIDGERLQQQSSGQSLPYLLAGTPALTLTSDGGSGTGYSSLRIRGTDATRINFTLDGIPLNGAEDQILFWVNMPDIGTGLSDLQIQRGAGTSTNGASAFGASVMMVSEKPSMEPFLEWQSSAGSFNSYTNTLKGSTGLLKDRFVLDGRLSDVRSDGFIERAAVRMDAYHFTATAYLGNAQIKLRTFGNAEKTYQSWNGVPSDMLALNRRYNSCGLYHDDSGAERFYDNQTDNFWQHHYHLLYSQVLDARWSLHATLHYTDGKGHYEEYVEDALYGDYALDRLAGSPDSRTDLVRRKWLSEDFYGIMLRTNYQSERMKVHLGASANRFIGRHFGRVVQAADPSLRDLLPYQETFPAGSAAQSPQSLRDEAYGYRYYFNTGDKRDFNLYAQGECQLSSRWSAYADLQYRFIDYRLKGNDDVVGIAERFDRRRLFPFFNPKAGLHYRSGRHSAYASFAVARHEPNRDLILYSISDGASAQAETLFDWEAGYDFRSEGWNIQAGVYYMKYRDQLVQNGQISIVGEPLTVNTPDSYRLGLELQAGVRLASWLNWEANASLSRNRIQGFTEYVDTYDADWNELPQTQIYHESTDISFSPSLVANSSFVLSQDIWSARLSSSYVGRQYLDNTSCLQRSLDPYFISQLQAGCQIKPQVRLDLFVYNLFNESYESSGWVWSYFLDGQRRQEAGYFTQAGTHLTGRLTLRF